MTEAEAAGGSAAAIEILVAELEASGFLVSRELLEQIYAIEERYQFDRDRHEAPGKIRAAVAVSLGKPPAGVEGS